MDAVPYEIDPKIIMEQFFNKKLEELFESVTEKVLKQHPINFQDIAVLELQSVSLLKKIDQKLQIIIDRS